MKTFRFTLKHDKGTVRITTTATHLETAKRIILAIENAPESAIIKTEIL